MVYSVGVRSTQCTCFKIYDSSSKDVLEKAKKGICQKWRRRINSFAEKIVLLVTYERFFFSFFFLLLFFFLKKLWPISLNRLNELVRIWWCDWQWMILFSNHDPARYPPYCSFPEWGSFVFSLRILILDYRGVGVRYVIIVKSAGYLITVVDITTIPKIGHWHIHPSHVLSLAELHFCWHDNEWRLLIGRVREEIS